MVIDHVRGQCCACRKTKEVQPGIEQALVEGEDHSLAGLELADLLGSRPFLAGTIDEELGVFVCYGESLYSIIDD